jgi:hypothetical protein
VPELLSLNQQSPNVSPSLNRPNGVISWLTRCNYTVRTTQTNLLSANTTLRNANTTLRTAGRGIMAENERMETELDGKDAEVCPYKLEWQWKC